MKLTTLRAWRFERLLGVVVTALGIFVAAGWLVGNQAMIRLVPGLAAMAFNTALLFIAAGACLILLSMSARSNLLRGLAGVLVVLSSAILLEHLLDVDLGVDWTSLHATVQDGNPRPGRIAPNTCLGFLFAGLAFVLLCAASLSKWRRWIATLLVYATLALGVTAFLGYMLGLEFMYRVAAYNGMAAPSAVGMSLVGIGLYVCLRRVAAQQGGKEEQPDRRITRTAALLLTFVAVVSGLSSFAMFKQGLEASMSETVAQTTKSNTALFATVIEQRLQLVNAAASNAKLQSSLERLAANRGDRAALTALEEIGQDYLPAGVVAMQFFGADGRLLSTVGKMALDTAEMSVKLARSRDDAHLLWQDGFVLRSQVPVTRNGRTVGRIVAEQRLNLLTKTYRDIQHVGGSSDFLLCGRAADDALCFPSRFYPVNMRIPMYKDGKVNLPINRALLGQSGVVIVTDLRGVPVIAGFAPIGDLGLAVVLKTDATEFLAPVRARFNWLLGLLLALVVAGTLALRAQVQPIARRLLSDQRWKDAVLETSNEAFLAFDQAGVITEWNAQAENTFGWRRDEVIGKPMADLIVPPSSREAYFRALAAFSELREGSILDKRVEMRALHRSGREFAVEVTISAVNTDDRYSFAAFLHDISDRKRVERQLHHQATHDTLTGLPNRAELLSRLEQAMNRTRRTQQSMALLFLDIDGFKQVNDTLGHEAGDQLLKAFGARLQQCVRKSDTVARLAGDEFTIVVENLTHKGDAETVTRKILDAMTQPFEVGSESRVITTSIGITVYEGVEKTVDELLSQADHAMYRAKHSGKNRFVQTAER